MPRRRYSFLAPVILSVTALGVLFIFAVVRENVRQTRALLEDSNLVAHTLEVQRELDTALLALTDAESGQRGFLLTGNDSYLSTYHDAVPRARRSLVELARLVDAAQDSRVAALTAAVEAQLAEIERTIEVRRDQGTDAALAAMSRTPSRRAMTEARSLVNSMLDDEANVLETRRAQTQAAYDSAVGGRIGSGILSALLLIGLAMFALAQVRVLRRNEQASREAAAHEQDARAEAERANRLKDDFLAVLSHELRTPLNAVLGWTQILQGRGPIDPAAARAVASIKRNAEAQQRLVEDLLDVSRIVTGKFRLEPRLFELRTAVAAAVEGVRPLADAKNLTLRVDLGHGAMVEADPYRIQQVANNLLSNAVKFTPDGGDIHVTLVPETRGTRLTIRDTGLGMAPELLPHVFDRFRQGDSGPTRAHGGLGLGLAIAKHIVDAHGGTIEARSDGPGLGAAFSVCLPAAAAARRTVDQRAPRTAYDPLREGTLEGVVALIVDDESDSRDLLSFALQQSGADVVVASSGGEALNLLSARRPGVILSDVQMPGMDGFELLAEVRRRLGAAAPPTVAITARARTGDAERAMVAGFAAHITKPVDLNVLLSTVRAIVPRAESPT